MSVKAGAALVEALFAMALSALVAASGVTVVRAQAGLAADVTSRSERNDAMRAALLTLRAELHAIEPRTDLRGQARDSIAVRVFRGTAIICGHRDSITFVRYSGLRLPDTTKDSILQIGAENVASIAAVTADTAACVHTPNEQVLAWRMSASGADGSVWLLFENGTYYLRLNALRYRRDVAAQPITTEVIDVARSGFYFRGDSIVRAVQVELTDRGTQGVATAWVRLPNGS
jgi:hypothetical protein